MRRRLSVATQMLALQVIAVLLAVLVVTPVLAVYQDRAFRDAVSRRALSTAETLASTSVLQAGLGSGSDIGVAGEAERIRSVSGAAAVLVRDADGLVVYSSEPSRSFPAPESNRTAVDVADGAPRLITATVPVIAGTSRAGVEVGDLVGQVTVARAYPHSWERIGTAAPALITYVLVGAGVGIAGSLLISRRIKRVTFGLEPQEIRGLLEHREAMLHGLREGVVGVDLDGHVTVANDEARRLMDLPADAVGRPIDDLELTPVLTEVLRGERTAGDLPVPRAGRMLVLNQMPVSHERRELGWVTTVRDRTEHVELVRQVAAWRDTTDVLRAQAHEFSNRMHTIAGLVELEEYDELATFLAGQRRLRSGWTDAVLRSIGDRPLAALLVAKGSQAHERGVELDLEPASGVAELPSDLTEDLLTVAGNLLDNAMDAVAPHHGRVTLEVSHDNDVTGADDEPHAVLVRVTDDGPGLRPESVQRIFESGYSTKPEVWRSRGWGLALCRMACEQRGGWIRVHTDRGSTRFEARLPYGAAVSGRSNRPEQTSSTSEPTTPNQR